MNRQQKRKNRHSYAATGARNEAPATKPAGKPKAPARRKAAPKRRRK
jgi:hypothetical protein